MIAIVSGKGVVSHCYINALITMNRRGYKTAVLDADITGPSILKLLNTRKATANEIGIFQLRQDGY